MVSFQEGSELLKELASVAVDAKQVERTAEALGEEIATNEHHHSEPLVTLPPAKTLYLGIDGTGIPLRAEELRGAWENRGWRKNREVKLCTVWSAESCDDEVIPIRDEGSVTYTAAIESASTPDYVKERSPFKERVWREAQHRRFPQAARQVALGDGAAWIWKVVAELFPGAIQIVDRKRHHCVALRETQRTLSGFLGQQIKTAGGLTCNFFGVHPVRAVPSADRAFFPENRLATLCDALHSVSTLIGGKMGSQEGVRRRRDLAGNVFR